MKHLPVGREVFEIFNTNLCRLSNKKGQIPFRNYPFLIQYAVSFSLFLFYFCIMALRARCWSFLCLILLVAILAILMKGIFYRWSLSFCRCLMACHTTLWDIPWFLTFQFVVTFLAPELQCVHMLLVGEFYLTISIAHDVIIFCRLSKSATHHKQGNDETCQDPYTDQALFHCCFTPFLSISIMISLLIF